jgi:hypothetical protein
MAQEGVVRRFGRDRGNPASLHHTSHNRVTHVPQDNKQHAQTKASDGIPAGLGAETVVVATASIASHENIVKSSRLGVQQWVQEAKRCYMDTGV